MTDPQDTPATLSDDDIETRPVRGADAYAGDDTGDDTADTSDTSDTGEDTGDTSDTSDTGDDS